VGPGKIAKNEAPSKENQRKDMNMVRWLRMEWRKISL